MNKFTRRIVTAAVSAALVGGAVLAAGGAASAAPLTTGGHRATAAVSADTRSHGDREARDARYQWVADQVAVFHGGREERVHSGPDARYSPWISDQLALFERR